MDKLNGHKWENEDQEGIKTRAGSWTLGMLKFAQKSYLPFD